MRGSALHPEQRILLCLHDGIDFPTAFLGAIKAGIVPVAVNTQLSAGEFAFMLADSRARAVVVSAPMLAGHARQRSASLRGPKPAMHGIRAYERRAASLAQSGSPKPATPKRLPRPIPTRLAFGCIRRARPGGQRGRSMFTSSLMETAEYYAIPVLGITESDIVFSRCKAVFRLWARQRADISDGGRRHQRARPLNGPSPASVARILREHRPTIFYGVPTLYNAMLAGPDLPRREETALRRCVSAGEPLPAEIGRRWAARIGVDILDGIGSTEMLHIFLSNWPNDVRYGSTGKPIPGYELRIVDDDGQPVGRGEIGDLLVNGPTAAAGYWNSRERSRGTFLGPWTRTGDKYFEDEDGYYVYCGRSDDMLKVSGMFVSPAEVEAALIEHGDVLEAAVVGAA